MWRALVIHTTPWPQPNMKWLIVSVLGQEEGYTVKYNPLPEEVPEGEGYI